MSLQEDAFRVIFFFCLAFACLTSRGKGQNKRIDQSEASGTTHRPIRSVGHKRIDQSEALGTSASTNQKRWAQAHRPIRSVLKGQRKRTNHHIVSRSREGAAHPIRFVWQGALADASSHQKEPSDQPTRSIDQSILVGLFSEGLSSDRLSSDGTSIKSESSDQPTRSIDRSISDGLSSDGLSSN